MRTGDLGVLGATGETLKRLSPSLLGAPSFLWCSWASTGRRWAAGGRRTDIVCKGRVCGRNVRCTGFGYWGCGVTAWHLSVER